MRYLLLTLLIGMTNFAFADDLLSILESGETESLVQEKSELSLAIRKALPGASAEQNIFLGFLSEDQLEKALYQWNSAFQGSEFSETPTGKALHAYVLFKNKLEVVGVESLFRVVEPEKIDPVLQRLWRLEASRDHAVWTFANIGWKKEWTKIFDIDTEVKVLSRTEFDPNDQDVIFELLKMTKLKTKSRAWLEWQMALSLAIKGDVAKAAKVLAHLLKDEQKLIGSDLIVVTAARLLYERGYLDAAIEYYNRVPKSSEYWFVAQEEKAWAYIRKGQPQDTMAVVKAVTNPMFAAYVGPEAIFLQSLAQLKVCDYKGASESIVDFRLRFKKRASVLMNLSQVGETPGVQTLFSAMKKGPVKLIELGDAAKQIPRYSSRDEVLSDLVSTWARLALESQLAGELYSRSLSEGTEKVGFQAGMDELRVAVEHRAQSAKSAAINLLKRRASDEVAEIQKILQKMHIVEAELIQQTSLSNRVISATKGKANNKKGTVLKADKYDLKFPFVGEQWFDEISNYKIDINKACVAKRTGG